jgi:TatD DNase family protein
MNSPAEVQRTVLRRQLQQAVALGKSITVHTREADEDIEAILKEEVPKEHKVGLPGFAPELSICSLLDNNSRFMYTALRILPNWRVGCYPTSPIYVLESQVSGTLGELAEGSVRLNDATVFQLGVITYSTNLNTAQVVREMTRGNEPLIASRLRIVLETDAP